MRYPLANRDEIDAILRGLPILEERRGAYFTNDKTGWPICTPEVRAFFKSVAPIFPDRRAACGAESPDSAYSACTRAIGC